MPSSKHEQEKGEDSTKWGRRLIVLTLRRHQDGIWITKLVERLNRCVVATGCTAEIEILALEDWLADGWLISKQDDKTRGIMGIVNRVSDAAPPALFKACCALLAVAETSLRIPVWNGSAAYSLCGNKWRHHILFRQAKLSAPTTMVYYAEQGKDATVDVDPRLFRQSATGATEVLVKPNAGGFGAGIKRISMPPRSAADTKTTTKITIPFSFEDGMALVQQYETPKDGKIYRVWFLCGKVQCATERTANTAGGDAAKQDDGSTSSSAEFISGCAGGNSCTFPGSGSKHNQNTTENHLSSNSDQRGSIHSSSASSLPATLPPRGMRPWKVSEEVRAEIEDQLLPLLTDAHCGSVEFLYSSCGVSAISSPVSSAISRIRDDTTGGKPSSTEIDSGKGPKRLYFDLNLLSTLPLTDDAHGDATSEVEGAAAAVWMRGFDPWLDLALGVWEFCIAANQTQTRVE